MVRKFPLEVESPGRRGIVNIWVKNFIGTVVQYSTVPGTWYNSTGMVCMVLVSNSSNLIDMHTHITSSSFPEVLQFFEFFNDSRRQEFFYTLLDFNGDDAPVVSRKESRSWYNYTHN